MIKWWKRIFFYILDVAIVNSFIICKIFAKSNITQKQYRLELVKNKYSYNTIHYPVKQIKDGTCKNCSFTKDYKTVKASTSKYMCNECRIY